MKATTTTKETYLTVDFESLSLLSSEDVIASSRMGGETYMNGFWNGEFIICTNRKYLRSKVKKGCNKGKTRVTVVTLK